MSCKWNPDGTLVALLGVGESEKGGGEGGGKKEEMGGKGTSAMGNNDKHCLKLFRSQSGEVSGWMGG